jgi:hypothetical protein
MVFVPLDLSIAFEFGVQRGEEERGGEWIGRTSFQDSL